MGAGEGESGGPSPGVKPGALTDLLRRIAGAPEEEQGGAWGAVLHPGATVGRFELVRELGRGGFGVVWEAKDRELGRSVAFKAVRAGGKTSLREERLLKEAEAAARLTHPNIVTLFDVARAEQGPYLVLELLRGQTLAESLSRGAPPVEEALRIIVEVAKGVAHAHGQGVIHRDLKPENVFLCDDGQVKVLDFGLAHAFGQRKLEGGTRGYMAPEQLRGAPEDERTDVFALGVILHELLSGKRPFPGEVPPGKDRDPPHRLDVAEVPSLGPLVARMLANDPVRRPRDGAEVLQALVVVEKELAGAGAKEGLLARPVTFLSELRRRRVIRALVAYAIFAFALLQVIEPVLHGLHLPEWVLSVAVVLLAMGFPITVALSWIYDLTRHGVRRTEVSPAEALERAPRGRRLAVLLGVLALIAAAPGVAWYVWKVRPAQVAATPGEAAVAAAPSVAVLAFADMSPGKDQEYFADGVAEEILNALAHVRGLRVIGRTSSFSFKGTKEDLKTIARKLDVGTLLEGSVRRDRDRIRVTAKLIAATDGSHLWSATYDREASSVFQVQDEIARATVTALLPKLLGRPEADPATLPATSAEAYNRYLVGRQHLARSSEDSARRAIRAFEQALEADEAYAPAWAGLAEALSFITSLSEEDATPYLERGLAAADRAVALAPSLAAGYASRILLRLSRWDWDGARADAERTIQIEPGSAAGHRRYAQVLRVLGGRSLELSHLEQGTILDPLSAHGWYQLGRGLRLRGRLEEARAAYHRALEIDPQHQWTIADMAALELRSGRPKEAKSWYARCESESERLWGAARVELALGHLAAARQAAAEYERRHGAGDPAGVAELHAVLGERDLAFEWLERAYQGRQPYLRWVKASEDLKPLHADPRWKPFIRKMKLPVD